MSTTGSALGEFLRARREQIRPAVVGLGSVPRRRVACLRCVELAMLAGISVDYYLRLEQGRDQHPSSQVLDALARALRLDVKATEHLHRLAGLRAARSPRPVAETAADGLDQLIDQISLPAIVTNRYQDVLAANVIARALSPGFAPGENFLRWRLLAPAARDFFVDWAGDRGRSQWVTPIRGRRSRRSPLTRLDRRTLGSERPVLRPLGT